RVIVHKTDASMLLCYAAHHDPAYHWAERRRLERHPTTGATQLVEIRERVEEIPRYVEVERPKPSLFAKITDAELLSYGLAPYEIGVFVRSSAQLARAQDALKAAGTAVVELGQELETKPDHVSISTMHLAKGLEFREVAAMACDDDVLPLQERIETVADDSDLEEVYNTERHLLYVACTRARDHLHISGAEPASEFLDDLQ
ncbi:MAG: hypothetical protein N2C14_09205, partial [Planctomycetales bacterium]